MKKLMLLFAIFLLGCSSTQLVSNWKNPDIVLFDAYKVLVVGMTQNEEVREDFESKLKREFKRRGVEAVRSIDLFDVKFTTSERSEEELTEVEDQLLAKDFDAILFTKIVGSEDKQTLRTKLSNIEGYYDMFREDYLSNQGIYRDEEVYDTYTVFHAETALYCICVGKERQLIWKAGIDITDPRDFNKSTSEYVKLLLVAMEEQDLILHKSAKNEITGI